MTEQWNGNTWTAQATQAAPSGSFLGSVSCPSAANCTAVGGYGDSTGHFLPLAEHWNGSTWQITPTPLPSRGKNGTLAGVSCPSANRCTAAGWWNRSVPTGAHNAWAEVWNGTTWRNQPTAPPTFRQTLLGISCVAARTCTAVGLDRQTRSLLAEHEGGAAPGLVQRSGG